MTWTVEGSEFLRPDLTESVQVRMCECMKLGRHNEAWHGALDSVRSQRKGGKSCQDSLPLFLFRYVHINHY